MSTRLDKYVWSVRLAKTRSQAAQAIDKGKVRLNMMNVKPAKEVKLGDEIQIIKHTSKFTYRVIQLLNNRVGAKLVKNYIIDITPAEEIEKLKRYNAAQSVYRDNGSGKPSKKDRRSIDSFMEDWTSSED
ncbi:MAG: RNA-binding S4 domain-containing protein [Crocinitomicaceae bacterium]|nr:RNA-binding S4 domain-containing protein [Crocinitomicaceae bacterium]